MTLWWCDVATGQADAGRQERRRRDPRLRVVAATRGGSPTPTVPERASSQIELYCARRRQRHAGDRRACTTDFSPAVRSGGKVPVLHLPAHLRRRSSGRFEFNFHFSATDAIYAVTLQRHAADARRRRRATRRRARRRPTTTTARTRKKRRGKDKEGQGQEEATGPDDEQPTAQSISTGSARSRRRVPIPRGRYGGLLGVRGQADLSRARSRAAIHDDDGPPTGGRSIYSTSRSARTKVILAGVASGLRRVEGRQRRCSIESDDDVRDRRNRKEKKVGDGKIDSAARSWRCVDPRLEWMQMFNEAWRLERDFYYDPGMGGLDWKAVGETLPRARALRRAPRRSQLHPRRDDRRARDLARLRRRRRRAAGAAASRPGFSACDFELDDASRSLSLQEDLPRARLELATSRRRSASPAST